MDYSRNVVDRLKEREVPRPSFSSKHGVSSHEEHDEINIIEDSSDDDDLLFSLLSGKACSSGRATAASACC